MGRPLNGIFPSAGVIKKNRSYGKKNRYYGICVSIFYVPQSKDFISQ
jgi:hypothetical protein